MTRVHFAPHAEEMVDLATRGEYVLPDLLERSILKVAYDHAHPDLLCSRYGKVVYTLDMRDDAGLCLRCQPEGPTNYSPPLHIGNQAVKRLRR